MGIQLLNWPASARVRAIATTRNKGFSVPPYKSFNTALHVGDNPDNVLQNRALLLDKIGHPIQWLNQVHGTEIAKVASVDEVNDEAITADGVITNGAGVVCAVQTADCLPLLICDAKGEQVAAVHAGWRGLASGIISATVRQFVGPPGSLQVWLGPAISQTAFEVGEEVYEAFGSWARNLEIKEDLLDSAFLVKPERKFMADIYQLAHFELNSLGVYEIFGGQACTWKDANNYFSFRREGITGRMTSAIWIEP